MFGSSETGRAETTLSSSIQFDDQSKPSTS